MTAQEIIIACCGEHRALATEKVVECSQCSERAPVVGDPLDPRYECGHCGDTGLIADHFGHCPFQVNEELWCQRGALHYHLEIMGGN